MTDLGVVRGFYAAFASGEVDKFDEVLAADWELRPPLFGMPGTRDGEKATVAFLHRVLGDVSYSVEDVYDAGGGVVACRNVLRAVLTGPFLGLVGPGLPIELMTMEHHHVIDGRIRLTWHLEDFFGVRQALLADGAVEQAA